jgi:hypothetical protein
MTFVPLVAKESRTFLANWAPIQLLTLLYQRWCPCTELANIMTPKSSHCQYHYSPSTDPRLSCFGMFQNASLQDAQQD